MTDISLIWGYIFITFFPACFTAYWAIKWLSNDSYETRKFFSIGMKVAFIEVIIRLVICII